MTSSRATYLPRSPLYKINFNSQIHLSLFQNFKISTMEGNPASTMSSTKPPPPSAQPAPQTSQNLNEAIFLSDLLAIWIFQAFSIFWLLWTFEDTAIFHEYPALFIGLLVLGVSGPAFVVLLGSWHRRKMSERARMRDLERGEGMRIGGCGGEKKVERGEHCGCCRHH